MLVLIGMMSAFLAESCQCDRTQGQQSVLTSANTVLERKVWQGICVAAETGRQMGAVMCYCLHLRKRYSGRASDLSRVALMPSEFLSGKAKPRMSNLRRKRSTVTELRSYYGNLWMFPLTIIVLFTAEALLNDRFMH